MNETSPRSPDDDSKPNSKDREESWADVDLDALVQETLDDYVDSMSLTDPVALTESQRYVLKRRLVRTLRKRIRDHQNEYIARLEEKNEELMNEVELLSDEGTVSLRQEFEAMKNLTKYLLYLSGYEEEDSPIQIPAGRVTDMRDVEMRYWWDDDAGQVVIEIEEYETS